MKAVRWYARRDVRIDNLFPPNVQRGTVKVKIMWSGICGSDVHEFVAGPILISSDEPHPLTGKTAPITIGHEFGGYVVEVGKDVHDIEVGDKVAVSPMLSCGKCFYCRSGFPNRCVQFAYMGFNDDGGMAEYVVVPRENVFVMDKSVPDYAVAFGEPVAVAVHATKMAHIDENTHVAVVGGGTIGMLILELARLHTPHVYLFESNRGKRDTIRKLKLYDGPVLDPFNNGDMYTFLQRTNGLGADIVFDAGSSHASAGLVSTRTASKSSLSVALNLARKGGKIIMVAIHYHRHHELDLVEFVESEKILQGSWTYVPSDFKEGIEAINSGKIDPSKLVTRKIYIDDIVENGLLELELNSSNHIKILVTPYHELIEHQGKSKES